MLTRLRVDGFKNLVGVDVRFGPFTCIAGANGVGKSNLFDAIRFLGALTDRPLIEAALSVRDEGGKAADLGGLFHRVGGDVVPRMSFEAEIIVSPHGVDDLGQHATASITFLRYGLEIAYRPPDSLRSLGTLEVLREELHHINLGDAREHLLFPHKSAWRASVVKGRRASPFISTEGDEGGRLIKIHQEGHQGRPRSLSAATLPRTALSSVNAAENPTATLARQEMRAWSLLQLEPLALRQPDEFAAPARLGMNGAHLPATIFGLARQYAGARTNGSADEMAEAVYARLSNRLAELLDDVRDLKIDRDDRRELLTLLVTDRTGTTYPARALSDGTLRFLALAVLAEDPEARGVLCLEEPENGIHPARLPAMLRLLQDIAVDVSLAVSEENPLRQVIVNTHSPSVVRQVPEESLVVATLEEFVETGRCSRRVRFRGLDGTWRAQVAGEGGAALGHLLSYLNPDERLAPSAPSEPRPAPARRVMDRPDIQLHLPLTATHA
jgi:predicted ATPase